MLATLWNSANLVNIMEDDLDVTEAVLLDDIMAIHYVGWHSAGEDLTEEDAKPALIILAPTWNGGAWQSNVTSRPSP